MAVRNLPSVTHAYVFRPDTRTCFGHIDVCGFKQSKQSRGYHPSDGARSRFSVADGTIAKVCRSSKPVADARIALRANV